MSRNTKTNSTSELEEHDGYEVCKDPPFTCKSIHSIGFFQISYRLLLCISRLAVKPDSLSYYQDLSLYILYGIVKFSLPNSIYPISYSRP